MIIDPQNYGQTLRIFTITENSSIDGLLIGAGQVVILKGTSVHTVTLTNFSCDTLGSLVGGNQVVVGSGINRVEVFNAIVNPSISFYAADTLTGTWTPSGITLSDAGENTAVNISGLSITVSNLTSGRNSTVDGQGVTVSTWALVDLADAIAGQLRFCSNATNGAAIVWSDGASWIPLTRPDTGWIANASAGDKTVAVADYASGQFGGSTGSGLNTLFGGLGDMLNTLSNQVSDLTKKLQAIETAGAANLLPNA